MEYYVTGQLAVINASNGSVRKIGQPNMVSASTCRPTGSTST
jgi:hypothetical protein